MKLAELCTVYPDNCAAPEIKHPGDALALAVRLKLRAQKGRLQAALDRHPQKSADRSGLGLRPYLAGDSLRALSARHLILQDELQTRIDVSPGRFCVSVFVHCYENMEFRSSTDLPNKMQTAWAVAGILEQMHTQQAQKVNIYQTRGADLGRSLIEHRSQIQRSHFCYILTDLLHVSKTKTAAVESLSEALHFINAKQGMVVVVRDPMETTEWSVSQNQAALSFEPLNTSIHSETARTMPEYQAGEEYLTNIKSQLNDLRTTLQKRGWDSLWCTADHPVERLLHQLTLRLSGLRIKQ